MMICMIGLASATNILTTNLSAYYRGENNFFDTINVHNSTSQANAYFNSTTVKLGSYAFDFKGNGFIDTGWYGNDVKSIDFWVQKRAASEMTVISNLDGTAEHGSEVLLQVTGPVHFIVIISGVVKSVISTSSITLNEWTHVTATWNTSSMDIYYNGLWEARTAISGASYTPAVNNLVLGRRIPTTQYSNALIDGVGLWNKTLTPAEVLLLNGTAGAGFDYPFLDASTLYKNISLTPSTGYFNTTLV